MNRQIMFLDCPAYLDEERRERCGLPAAVQRRFIMNSTDGPLESAAIRCPAGHFFNGPVEFLTYDKRESRAGGDDRLSQRRIAAALSETEAEQFSGRRPRSR
jgi:hypothetical protein